MSTKEVYDKASNILRAIEQCSCDHCLEILKIGLVTSQTTVDTVTSSGTNRNDQF